MQAQEFLESRGLELPVVAGRGKDERTSLAVIHYQEHLI
jgi:hypothetical protein